MSQYCDHLDVSFCERDSFEAIFDDAPDYIGFAQAVTSTRILGYFASAEALTEAVPNPNIGDTYGIGDQAPYNLYVYSANGWIDNGSPSGPPGPPGPQGDEGPPGPAAAVTSWEVRYQASASGTTIPTGTWSTSIPEVYGGQFLWTRNKVTYSDGTTTTSYSVVRGAGGIASNPNLLDNPWFSVNQKGQTSYTGKTDSYTVDRWKTLYSTLRVEVLAGIGIRLSTTSTGSDPLRQILSTPIHVGDTVTLTILYTAEATATGGAIRFVDSSGTARYFIALVGGDQRRIRSVSFTSEYELVSVDIRTPNNGALTVHAVKREYGSVSTLANDHAPDYATELLKCQRHQYLIPNGISNAPWAIGYAINAQSIRVFLNLPVPLRSRTPSLEFLVGDISQMTLISKSGNIVPTAVTVQATANAVVLIFTVAGATPNETYFLSQPLSNLKMMLNANL